MRVIRFLSPILVCLNVWIVVFRSEFDTVSSNLFAIAIFSISGLIFFATIRETKSSGINVAFTSDMGRGIILTGPYRFVRHPFYLSYILFWWAWPVLGLGNVLLYVSALTMTAIYWWAAVKEEGYCLNEVPASYAEYKKNTGRFFPKIRV